MLTNEMTGLVAVAVFLVVVLLLASIMAEAFEDDLLPPTYPASILPPSTVALIDRDVHEKLQNEYDALWADADKNRRQLLASEKAREGFQDREASLTVMASAREAEARKICAEVRDKVEAFEKRARDAMKRERLAKMRASEARAETTEAYKVMELAQTQIKGLEQKLIDHGFEDMWVQEQTKDATARASWLETQLEDRASAIEAIQIQTQMTKEAFEIKKQTLEKEIKRLDRELAATKEDHLVAPKHLQRLKNKLVASNRRIEELKHMLDVKKEDDRREARGDYKIRIIALEKENEALRRKIAHPQSSAAPSGNVLAAMPPATDAAPPPPPPVAGTASPSAPSQPDAASGGDSTIPASADDASASVGGVAPPPPSLADGNDAIPASTPSPASSKQDTGGAGENKHDPTPSAGPSGSVCGSGPPQPRLTGKEALLAGLISAGAVRIVRRK
ncbi:hypothetical protein LTR08_003487 [Meristemomyces frigidus]|nr:hypothetical protein LTR08_003487 [Meristemomyces frigidus]